MRKSEVIIKMESKITVFTRTPEQARRKSRQAALPSIRMSQPFKQEDYVFQKVPLSKRQHRTEVSNRKSSYSTQMQRSFYVMVPRDVANASSSKKNQETISAGRRSVPQLEAHNTSAYSTYMDTGGILENRITAEYQQQKAMRVQEQRTFTPE